MPSISRIRFTNIVYDGGKKRYIDTIFQFDGYNGILLLENGAGKTVFVQTLIQAVLPRKTVAQRKIQETLQLNNSIAHIGVEWILEDTPRVYALTAVSLFMNSRDQLSSQEFTLDYTPASSIRLDTLPFVREEGLRKRPATKEEMASYYRGVADRTMNAHFFSENDSLQQYGIYIEEHFRIIPAEWNKIAAINETEGGVEAFFENCRSNDMLVDRLLIPTVEEGLADENGTDKGQGNGFAQLFEKQRNHFRQQRILQKRIEEMKGVVTKMEDYTQVQKVTYEAEQALLAANGKVKALYNKALEVQQKRQLQQQELEKQEAALEVKRAENTQALEACLVAESDAVCQRRGKDYTAADAAYKEAEDQRLREAVLLDNLKFARLRDEHTAAQAKEYQVRKHLEELARDTKIQEYQAQLDRNSQYLHFLFQKQEQELKAHRTALTDKKSHLEQLSQETRQQKNQLGQKEGTLTSAIGRTEGRIRTLVEAQERLESRLFPDSLQQDAATQRQIWETRQAQVEKAITENQAGLEFYEKEAANLEQQQAKIKDQLQSVSQDVISMDLQLAKTDSRADILRQRLQQVPKCANLAAVTGELYQREEFMQNQLGDLIIARQNQEDKLAFSCRQSHRYLDQFEKAQEFTADPLLTDLVQEWARDFPYLQTGTEAYQSACKSGHTPEELQAVYPFWAATLITSEPSMLFLQKRLLTKCQDLSQPVFLLTDGELRQILQEASAPAYLRTVVPGYWSHILPDDFNRWLDQLQEEAVKWDLELSRVQVEKAELQQLKKDLTLFYEEAPFSEYQELTQSRDRTKAAQERLVRQQEQNEATLAQCRCQIETYRNAGYEYKRQQEALEQKLGQLKEYESLQEQQRQVLVEKDKLSQQRQSLQQQIVRKDKELTRLSGLLQALYEELGSTRNGLKELKDKPYYVEVQQAPPLETTQTYSILAEQRRHLQSLLDGIQENRGRLEEKLSQSLKDQQRTRKEMAEVQSGAEQPLDEELPYPIHGLEKEEELRAHRPLLQKACQQTGNARDKAKQAYDQAIGQYENDKKRYFAQYTELLAFTEDLKQVRPRLEAQKSLLAKAFREYTEAQKENDTHLAVLAETLHKMDTENVTLQFTIDEVPAALLPPEWDTLDSQFFHKAAPSLLRQSRHVYERTALERQKNQQAKELFIKYCEDHILQEKRRRHIVDGIRSKTSYQEYLTWKDMILNTIQKGITIAEGERKEHFTHIEHMVEHMALYTQEILKGFKEIASKTRIRLTTGTKDIYTVHFNEKKDSDVRTAIRSYLNTLTERLDSQQFLGEDGREDSVKVKEEITKKLRTQQILNEVYGAHAIKVKCRKATSSETFSERPYDWEDSNKWSGGEMWCKNMALFLGCLNYLSEKRVRVPHTKHHNRVVVADNPFGKASSEHVLNPVFFIAEQLGFQIIALTAHEDGSFIRKYFPVVYSCHFATVPGTDAKVLEPQKEIETAFFAENDPQALTRLEDYQEADLFK